MCRVDFKLYYTIPYQSSHQIYNLMSVKEVWVLVLDIVVFLSAVSLGFSLALDPRCRLSGLRGKVGSACEEFEDNELRTMKVVYQVNVCESSGSSSPRFS